MIVKYEIRSTYSNRLLSSAGLPLFTYSSYDDKHDAIIAAKNILNQDRGLENRIYITRTEYANEDNRRRDFHITSSIVWSGYFHGADALDNMILSASKQG